MKTATGLTLIAIGAIFAFAITAHPSWINLQIVGWVIMVTGVLGMVLSRRSYAWLRRARVTFGQPEQPASGTPPAITATVVSDEPAPGNVTAPPPPAAEPPGQPPPGPMSSQEVIEEFRQE